MLYYTQNFEMYRNNWYKVNDEFAVISISKNACSTVNVQSWTYRNKLDINLFKKAEYAHLNDVKLDYIFQKQYNRRFILTDKPDNLKYVCIIRDPIQRFISTFNTTKFTRESDFNIFLKDVVKSFKLLSFNRINQHIQPQSAHFNFEDVDVFVYASGYDKFCNEYNIPFIKLNQNPNKNYQNNILLSDDNIEMIKNLYKEDYNMIDKIKQSGKLYGSL